MHSYLMILEVTPLNVGKTYAMLPLHCTLVHWFRMELDPANFTEKLEMVARNFAPLDLTAATEAIYTGKTKQGVIPVTVNIVELTQDLKELHFQICEKLDELGVHYTAPQYVKEGYTPHVTVQNGEKLPIGVTHTSAAIYLVEADAPEYGNDRRICSKIEFVRSE